VIVLSYTFEIKTTKKNSRADIWGLKSGKWKITSEDYVTMSFPYKDNVLTVTASFPNTEEPSYNAIFSIDSISDVFWMILSMTASGVFQFKNNEPLQIIRKCLNLF
jgi:hypothetical protein